MATTRTFGTYTARRASGALGAGDGVQFFAITDPNGATPLTITAAGASTGGTGTTIYAGPNGEIKFTISDASDLYTEGYLKSGSGPLQYVRAQGKMAATSTVFEVIWSTVAGAYPTPPSTAPEGTLKRLFTGPSQPSFAEWAGIPDAWDVWNPA